MSDIPAPLTEGHIPVLLNDVIETLAPQSGDVIVDGTFGGGSYTQRILNAADCKVIGIDRDPDAVTRGQTLAADDPDFTMVKGCFGDMKSLIDTRVDGIVLDLGVSSFQIDESDRGFSFMRDGPLDMRMSQQGDSAADLVNTLPEEELANILYKYGEERKSRRIAHKIIERRKSQKFENTLDLADTIESVLGRKKKPKDPHPATRSFQALRIAVNDELGELDRALEASIDLLKPDGRLVVVSFHSLEDRRVKTFFREKSGDVPRGSRHMPVIVEENELYWFRCPERRPRTPSAEEAATNPRARSAKLRFGIRTDHEVT
jgi:16S rRNA (cytosine1402-N4)-methyltransferase